MAQKFSALKTRQCEPVEQVKIRLRLLPLSPSAYFGKASSLQGYWFMLTSDVTFADSWTMRNLTESNIWDHRDQWTEKILPESKPRDALTKEFIQLPVQYSFLFLTSNTWYFRWIINFRYFPFLPFSNNSLLYGCSIIIVHQMCQGTDNLSFNSRGDSHGAYLKNLWLLLEEWTWYRNLDCLSWEGLTIFYAWKKKMHWYLCDQKNTYGKDYLFPDIHSCLIWE